MKILILIYILLSESIFAQEEAIDLSVPLTVEIDSSFSPAKLKLSWKYYDDALRYKLLKKDKDSIEFGYPFKVINTKTDTLITELLTEGKQFDYGIEKFGEEYSSYGYISIGYNIPAVHYRGKILLLIDETIYNDILPEINQYQKDLIGDGWLPVIVQVPRAEEFDYQKVQIVKNLIKKEYYKPDSLVSAVLIGRVPVPYSGHFAIDGHEDHIGAWPSDVYYADIDGNWTDTINYEQISLFPRQFNIAGDGKFDNNRIPSDADIQTGRIDFYNLPAYSESEVELIKRYLNKNHKWRNFDYLTSKTASLINNFSVKEYKESFVSNGWQNITSLIERKKIYKAVDHITLQTNNALWYWGAGSGSFNSSYKVAYTDDFANKLNNGVFTVIFGSYNGDWDSEDNVLRAALASRPSILTSAWAGRPFWQFIHMGLGENIGYSTIISQNNNSSTYISTAKYGSRGVHIALMGDPTLRMHIMPTVDTVYSKKSESNIQINWEINTFDTVEGYYIYRSTSLNEPFRLLNKRIITDTFFVDQNPAFGFNYYMVRTTRLENTVSGSFHNLGTGKITKVDFFPNLSDKKPNIIVFPNPVFNEFNVAFYSEKEQTLSISIFDLSGKKIANIFKGISPKGWNQNNFNLNSFQNLSSGTYYIVLSTKEKMTKTKFIIQK